MKVWSDEEIQKMLEQGESWNDTDLSAAQKEDLEAYKMLFEDLKREPAGNLPYNFSKNVVLQLQNQTNRTSNFKFYLLLVILLVAGSAMFYLLLLYNDDQIIPPIFHAIISYKWPLLFCLSSVFIIQYLDYKLVKETNRTSHF